MFALNQCIFDHLFQKSKSQKGVSVYTMCVDLDKGFFDVHTSVFGIECKEKKDGRGLNQPGIKYSWSSLVHSNCTFLGVAMISDQFDSLSRYLCVCPCAVPRPFLLVSKIIAANLKGCRTWDFSGFQFPPDLGWALFYTQTRWKVHVQSTFTFCTWLLLSAVSSAHLPYSH